MEILVAVRDMTVADELLRSLTWRLERSPLAFDPERSEVRVPQDSEIGTVDLVIDTVEAWLAHEGRGASAELRIGESVYVLDGSARGNAARSNGSTAPSSPHRHRQATSHSAHPPPSLNHLFTPGEGPPSPAEYEPAQHVDATVVTDIANWLPI